MNNVTKQLVFILVFAFVTISMHDWIFRDNLFVKSHKKHLEHHNASTEIVHHNYSMQYFQTIKKVVEKRKVESNNIFFICDESLLFDKFVKQLWQPPKFI